jgi:hypothetical protein
MGNFGKLNFSVSFDRTSAFPLDGNSYFTSYSDAELAASSAVEVGSSDSAYYIGQMLTVVEGNSSKNYIIQPDKTLSEVGSGSGSGSPEVVPVAATNYDTQYLIRVITPLCCGDIVTISNIGTFTLNMAASNSLGGYNVNIIVERYN